MLTDEDLFCEVCQIVKNLCPGHEVPPLSFVTVSLQSENGYSGDSALSPENDPVTSMELPAVTAVTPPPEPRGRHARAGDKNGNNLRSVSPGKSVHRVTSWTAAQLMATDFPPPKWIVPGIIPEGLTLLAGAPKVGKSWLCLGLGTAITSGGRAFGSIQVEPGAALYLALEDTGRRLKSRLTKVLAGSAAPPGFDITIECEPGLAGMARIDDWLSRDHEHAPRLVMVDVLEKMRGPVPQGMSVYSADYAAISMIKQIADLHGVSIIVLTHVRKGTADDWLSEISGTLGLSGAADTIAVLKRARGELDGTLQVTGRDVDEEDYAFRFDAQLASWNLIGKASDYGLTETRRKILSWLRQNDGSKPSEIAIGTGLDRNNVKQTCIRMAADGQIDSDGQGRYLIPVGAQ